MYIAIPNDDAKDFRGTSADPLPLGLGNVASSNWPTGRLSEQLECRISPGSTFFEADSTNVWMYGVEETTDSSGNTIYEATWWPL